jgi:hypothetical protein
VSEKKVNADFIRATWEGFSALRVRVKVVDGPKHMIDREIMCRIPFEQLDVMMEQMTEARNKLAATDAKVAAMNVENQE